VEGLADLDADVVLPDARNHVEAHVPFQHRDVAGPEARGVLVSVGWVAKAHRVADPIVLLDAAFRDPGSAGSPNDTRSAHSRTYVPPSVHRPPSTLPKPSPHSSECGKANSVLTSAVVSAPRTGTAKHSSRREHPTDGYNLARSLLCPPTGPRAMIPKSSPRVETDRDAKHAPLGER